MKESCSQAVKEFSEVKDSLDSMAYPVLTERRSLDAGMGEEDDHELSRASQQPDVFGELCR